MPYLSNPCRKASFTAVQTDAVSVRDACGHLFFEAINLNIDKLWHERGILFGLVETRCRYFKPGRYHDEIYIIKRSCLEDVSDRESFSAPEIPDDIYAVLNDAKNG